MTHVSRLPQSNYNWLGDGSMVYTTGYKPNTPFAWNPALQQIQKPYKDAQLQRRAQQAADKTARQGNVTVYDAVKKQYVSATPEEARLIYGANKKLAIAEQLNRKATLSPSIIDRNLGLDRAAKSAEESAAVFAEHAGKLSIAEQLNRRATLSPSIIDRNLGLDRATKSAEESAAVFAGHGLTDTEKALGATTQSTTKSTAKSTTKSKGLFGKFEGIGSKIKGFFGKAKDAIKNGFSSFKSFAKTPKGKYTLIAAAIITAGAALFGYIADRFSGKYDPKPTNGPDKINMAKLDDKDVKKTEKVSKTVEDDDDEVEEAEESEKTDKTQKTDDDDNDEVEEAEESEKTDKTQKTDNDDNDEVEEAEESEKTDKTQKTDDDDNDEVEEAKIKK